jgi:hypothetical protein
MWKALCNVWHCLVYPTAEYEAAYKAASGLPFWQCFKARMKAAHHWPVFWRRAVALLVVVQIYNVGFLAVRGFQIYAVDRFSSALPPAPDFIPFRRSGLMEGIMSEADLLASSACWAGIDPRTVNLAYDCQHQSARR